MVIKLHNANNKNRHLSPTFQKIVHGNWECYLRRNVDPALNLTEWNRSVALDHYRQQVVNITNDGRGCDEKRQNEIDCACKVIVLAGPHKAASSTLQHIAVKYSKLDNVPWKWIGKGEKALAPVLSTYMEEMNAKAMKEERDRNKNRYRDRKRDRYCEVKSMRKKRKKWSKKCNTFKQQKQKIKEEILLKYKRGYNIILGAEALDRMTLPAINGSLIDDFVLDILPTKVFNNHHLITSVVVYRSPRVKHIISLWKQFTNVISKDHKMTFYQFLCDGTFMGRFEAVDSLLLTQTLINKGLKVQLVDMGGVISTEGVDFFSVLGCNVMKLPCQTDNHDGQLIPIPISEHVSRDKILKQMTMVVNAKEMNFSYNVTKDQEK